MTSATLAIPTMTADEFLRDHADDSRVELVDGQLRRLPMPGAEHGRVCSLVNYYLTGYTMLHNLGRVVGNDTFIRTRIDPVGFRGADVCYISFATLPADQPMPAGHLIPPLELVVEVRSPSDSIPDMTEKAAEYNRAGVQVVLVLDPQTESVAVFREHEFPQRFHNGDRLTLPDILPGFDVPIARFFQ